MIPVTIKLKSLLPWAYFGIREAFRMLVDFILQRGPREQQLAAYVERNAQAGDVEDVIRVIDIFAKKRFLMNVGEDKGAILDKALADTKAKRVVELGCYCDYSAVRIARHLKQTGGKLISIEKSEFFASCAQRVIDHAGLSDHVEIRIGSAEEQIPSLTEELDVVFIDHWKDAYLPDLQMLEKAELFRPGTIVVADNIGVFENTLVDYLQYVRENAHYSSTYFPSSLEYFDAIEDGVEVSIWQGQEKIAETN